MNVAPPKKMKHWWIPIPALLIGLTAGVWTSNSKTPVQSPVSSSLSNIERSAPKDHPGRLLYLSNCARCHGLEGRGDGPESAGLAGAARPRDFTSTDWKSDARSVTIEQILNKGVPGTSMAAFGSTISENDRQNLIRYVETLAPPEARIPNNHSQRKRVQDLVDRFGWQWSSDRLKPGTKLGSTDGDRPEVTVSEILKTASQSETRLQFVQAWGVHCAICVEKLPETAEIQSVLSRLGYGYELICVDEPSPTNVQAFLTSKGIKTKSLTDSDNGIKLSTDLSLLPATMLVDEYGNILAKFTGVFDWRNVIQPSGDAK